MTLEQGSRWGRRREETFEALAAPAGVGRRRGMAHGPRLGGSARGAVSPVLHAHPPPRRPLVGLCLLVPLALLTFFIAWVSAEPFWMAMGHHHTGTVEVSRCAGQGELGARCVGVFHADHPAGGRTGDTTVERAALSGAAADDITVGQVLPARMVSPDSRIAYVGDAAGLRLRWLLGAVLLLAAGFGIAWATGAWRLREGGRTGAVAASVAAPFVVAAAMLALSH